MNIGLRVQLSFLFIFCCLSAPALYAAGLPTSCGSDRAKFDIKSKKDQPLPEAPSAGMAQIIFIESLRDANALSNSPIARFAVDGAWVGATKAIAESAGPDQFSYFAVAVTPGEHHFCSVFAGLESSVGLDTFTAQAGNVYVYQLQLTIWPADRKANAAEAYNLERGGTNSRPYTAKVTFERMTETASKDILKRAQLSISKTYR